MGKEKDKDKKEKEKEKDKDKDKDKEKKEKKEKDKEKDKEKEKEKDKEKDKKDKEKKDKEKDKYPVEQEWKLPISKNLDVLTHIYEKITNKLRDIDNYILRDAKSKEEFIEKVKKYIEDLPEASQQVFSAFLNSIT